MRKITCGEEKEREEREGLLLHENRGGVGVM